MQQIMPLKKSTKSFLANERDNYSIYGSSNIYIQISPHPCYISKSPIILYVIPEQVEVSFELWVAGSLACSCGGARYSAA